MQINQSQPRLEKAFKNLDRVCNVSQGKFYVQSDSRPDKFYEIFDDVLTCQCEDSSFNNVKCWHLYAVEMYKKKVNIQ